MNSLVIFSISCVTFIPHFLILDKVSKLLVLFLGRDSHGSVTPHIISPLIETVITSGCNGSIVILFLAPEI